MYPRAGGDYYLSTHPSSPMMVNCNLLVAFGPSPDAFFISYGTKMSYSNMPQSLTNTFTKEAEMNPMKVSWLRIHPNGRTWAAKNMYNNNIWYDTSMSEDLVACTRGDRYGLNKASSISWAHDGEGYFVKFRERGSWRLHVPECYPSQVHTFRNQIQNFDLGLKAVLFGYGGTHIYIFERGFAYNLEGAAESEDHPLHKVLKEFEEPGWQILEGSSLSLHNDEHFALKFTREGSSDIRMRWCLSDEASAALDELMAIANDPQEQAALQQYEQTTQRSELFNANLRFSIAQQTSAALFGH